MAFELDKSQADPHVEAETGYKIEIKPIGLIRSPFKSKTEAPYQGCRVEHTSELEIFQEYQEGLRDIEGFSHLIVIYYFHQSNGYSLITRTPWDIASHGVFSTRSCYRPCPLGLSVARLIARDGNVLKVKELDAIDGTPILDIKPYVSGFDQRDQVKIGWMEGKLKPGPLY